MLFLCAFCIASYVFSLHSYVCIIAYQLGTLDVRCAELKDMMLELNQKMVFGGQVEKMEGLIGLGTRTEMLGEPKRTI